MSRSEILSHLTTAIESGDTDVCLDALAEVKYYCEANHQRIVVSDVTYQLTDLYHVSIEGLFATTPAIILAKTKSSKSLLGKLPVS